MLCLVNLFSKKNYLSRSAQNALTIPSSLPSSDQKFLDWNVTAVAEQFVLIGKILLLIIIFYIIIVII